MATPAPVAAVAEERPSFGRVLRNRPFFLLWISQLVSQSGDYIFEVALLWLVLQVTGSVFAIGLVVAVFAAPSVLLAPVVGVYVDRWDRRRVLVITNLLEGVVVAALAGTVLLHAVDLSLTLVIVALLGSGGTLVRTASSAMVPQTVPTVDLAPANSLLTFSGSFNQIVGYTLGGVAVALLGVTVPIEYDALSFFIAAALVTGIGSTYGRPPDAPATPSGFVTEFKEGLAFIRANRFLVELIALGFVVNFFGNAAAALFAPYAKLVLHGGASVYGVLVATIAVGTIVGAGVVGKINARRSVGKLLLGGGVGIGALLVGFGLVTTILPAVGVAVTLGVVLAVTNIPISVLIQARVPGRLLGRVGAVLGALIGGAGPLGAFYSGSLAEASSIPTVFLVSGAAVVAIMAFGWLVLGELRRVSY